MVPNALQAVSAYVIPPLLGFIVLLGLALVSLLRGGGSGRTSCLPASVSSAPLLNADMALVSIVSDELLQPFALTGRSISSSSSAFPSHPVRTDAFLGIRGRRWLEVPAWLLSIASRPCCPPISS